MRVRVRWLVGLYVAALVASHVVRATRPAASPAPLPFLTVAGPDGAPIRIGWLAAGAQADSTLPVVLLLHGSPGDHGEMEDIADALAGSARVLAPDLPGFGASTRDVANYSFIAHADAMAALLDSLELRGAHVVGFSRGGAVALELAARRPELVGSITLLAAMAVQEHELLGDHRLNRALHAAQLAGLWLLEEAVPHFGAFDGGMLSVAYARNFYEGDQRPLRKILAEYRGPMLILHGRDDRLVPVSAATEHHRLVPQSRLVLLAGGHFLPWTHTDTVAAELRSLMASVAAGTARVRLPSDPTPSLADPGRGTRAEGLTLVLLLFLLALATLISEDLACIGAGLMVARGVVPYWPAVAACFVGIVVGDLLLFLVGRLLGRPVVERAPMSWFVSREAIARGTTLFRERGASVVLASRFLPGTRLPTYLAAGILHASFWRFAWYSIIAVGLWTPLLVGLAALFGEAFAALFGSFERRALPTVLALIASWLGLRLALGLATWRGRRLLLSRWRRLTRWEFWPMWAFYPPVVLRAVWLGVRHRSLTLFTCANPAMPSGGFVGESKAAILGALAEGCDRVAPFRLLRSGPGGIDAARRAMAELGLDFPVVLKPDVGERGSGVGIIRDDPAMQRYLAPASGAVILQQYVSGVEAGLFYYRIPGDESGHLFALTDKRFPTVTGDGRRTLETLILADDRAVCMARFLLDRHRTRLAWVPVAGESVPLVELGTHCRGSAFFDGASLRTRDLEREVDRVSRTLPGFWFGRYDVRSPSHEALRRGEFTVIELNGASAEATSIYDPRYSVFDAWRVLFTQWDVLFAIGARNRAQGCHPMSLRQLVAELIRHRNIVAGHVAA
jgi:pimeloyl-ACP methyl ester carboxylesterase/membrane protein DedA with SNARE-associated domain